MSLLLASAVLGVSAATPLSISGSSGKTINGGTVSNGTVSLVSAGSSSVTAAGGVPPYTYAWSRTAGDAEITANSATADTTFWSSTGTDQARSASYKCTVTDAALNSVEETGFDISATHGTPP